MKFVKLVIIALAITCTIGCGGPSRWQELPEGEYPFGGPEEIPVENEYRLAVGDELSLRVAHLDGFDTEAIVRPDGKVTFPLVGEMMAAGLTPSELDSLATEKLTEMIIEPDVAVVVKSYTEQLVYVLGEVITPGAYELRHGMTVTQALTAARGPTTVAKLTDVVLIRRETPYKATGVKLDIEHFLEDGNYEVDAQLRSYDIVYVPRTKIGTVSVFLEQVFKAWTYPLTVIVRGYDLILLEQKGS